MSNRYAGRVIELACRSRECAPPPVGDGGSLPGGGSATYTVVKETWRGVDLREVDVPTPSGKVGKVQRDDVLTELDEPIVRWSPGRSQISVAAKALASGEESGRLSPPELAAIGETVRATQRLLRDGGVTHVELYRGIADGDHNPFDRASSELKASERTDIPSGISSWTTDPDIAKGYGFGNVAKALVPADRIVSFDLAGMKSEAHRSEQNEVSRVTLRGKEVLVAADPAIVERLAGLGSDGDRPEPTASLVSGLIELACRSAECAPPPAGKGGSLPGKGKRSAKRSAKRAKSLKQVMAGIDALVDEEGVVQLTTDSPFLQTVLEQYAHEVGLRDTPPSPEVAYGMLLDMVETRLAVSEALKSADPEPAFVEVLQHAHREVAKEMGSEPRQVWRLVQEGTDDPFDPVGGPHGYQMRADSRASGTGVTSWWDWNDEADEEWPFRGNMRSATAAVVVEVEVTAKQVLGRIGDMRDAGEVLVAKSPEVVDRLMAGKFPIVSKEMRVATASAAVELACRSAECAPPPVGRGGSLPQSQSVGISDRVRQTVEDAKEVGSQDPRDERYDTARAFMRSREEAIARLERDVRVSGAHPTSTTMAGFREEFDALSAVVPIGEGMVRRGTEAAAQLEAQARSALPELKSFVIAGDVNGRVVSESIDVLAQYPEEARSEIQSLVVGRWPSEDGSKPAAAWGGHADESGPYNTLWLTPKLVGATDGEIAEGIGLLGKPADRSSEDVSIMMADPDRRHRIAIAHEMGHVLHSKAIRQEGQWNRMAGMTKAMQADPVARQVTQPGGRRRPIMTTVYGEENTAETVAESFALAALDGFDNITDDQQAVVRQVLERALGPTDLTAVTDLQFAERSDDDDEYGQGDRMAPLTDTFQLPTE